MTQPALLCQLESLGLFTVLWFLLVDKAVIILQWKHAGRVGAVKRQRQRHKGLERRLILTLKQLIDGNHLLVPCDQAAAESGEWEANMS